MMFTNELEFENTVAGSDLTFFGNTNPAASPQVIVEARTPNGRLWQLPVEFVAPCSLVPELSQVNFILKNEMTGIGHVQLTLIVNGERSKSFDISVV